MRSFTAALFCAALTLQLALAGSALGQAATTPSKGEDTPLTLPEDSLSGAGSDGGGGLVRTIVGLAIVIGVIYGITWVLKQVKHSRDDNSSGNGLSAAATLPLGAGRSVQVVRAGDEYLLLGVADSAVSVLRTYTEAEAIEAGFAEAARPDDDDDAARPVRPLGQRRPASHDTFANRLLDRLRGVTVRR